MFNHSDIVSALTAQGITCYYAKVRDSKFTLPCVTYQKTASNSISSYSYFSDVSYHNRDQWQISLFIRNIAELETYNTKIETAMRGLQFEKVGYTEIEDSSNNLLQCVYTYQIDNNTYN